MLEEVVPAVTDSRSEEGAVGPLEPFQGPGVIEREALQGVRLHSRLKPTTVPCPTDLDFAAEEPRPHALI